jgi:predicted DNA-binding antitoxin AbrB/MazE fold protein
MLGKTVRARYKGNRLVELLEPVELEEGKEVTITILDLPRSPESDAFEKAAGGWVGIVDVDAFLKDRERTKRIRRPRIKL